MLGEKLLLLIPPVPPSPTLPLSCSQPQRHRANRARILRNDIALRAISTRHATHEQAININQRNAKPINLQLGYIIKFAPFG